MARLLIFEHLGANRNVRAVVYTAILFVLKRIYGKRDTVLRRVSGEKAITRLRLTFGLCSAAAILALCVLCARASCGSPAARAGETVADRGLKEACPNMKVCKTVQLPSLNISKAQTWSLGANKLNMQFSVGIRLSLNSGMVAT